jgi:NitT/TauT family transport system permease protein
VSLLICAWLVAFFPILSNTTLGLNSVDHNLLNLFELYGASALADAALSQAAGGAALLPGGLKISGGPGADRRGRGRVRRGLRRPASRASPPHPRIGLPAQDPALFAALVLISLTGIAIFMLLSA